MKKVIYFAVAILTWATLPACQKVIDVNLNDSAQQYVIEGEINDGIGPYTIRITKTKNFAENNTFEGVTGAQVIITDRTRNIRDTLTSPAAGVYQTSRIRGRVGRVYDLSVTIGTQKFEATSAMPAQAVLMDSVTVRESALSERIYAVPVFRDPPGKGNYYRMRVWVNNVQLKSVWVYRDDISDGYVIDNALRYDPDDYGDPEIKKGDNVRVELQCINKDVYNYFRSLSSVENADTAVPTNPVSNIKGGALGVFNTCTRHSLTIKSSL